MLLVEMMLLGFLVKMVLNFVMVLGNFFNVIYKIFLFCVSKFFMLVFEEDDDDIKVLMLEKVCCVLMMFFNWI